MAVRLKENGRPLACQRYIHAQKNAIVSMASFAAVELKVILIRMELGTVDVVLR